MRPVTIKEITQLRKIERNQLIMKYYIALKYIEIHEYMLIYNNSSISQSIFVGKML